MPVILLLCCNTAKLVSSPGVSWFISADELRSEARKENRPDKDEPTRRPSTSWFEPCSRIKPWREPLRQRQVPEDGNRQASFTHHNHPGVERRTKPGSSGLMRLSLQVSLCYHKSYLTNVDHPKVTIQSNVNKCSTFVLCWSEGCGVTTHTLVPICYCDKSLLLELINITTYKPLFLSASLHTVIVLKVCSYSSLFTAQTESKTSAGLEKCHNSAFIRKRSIHARIALFNVHVKFESVNQIDFNRFDEILQK